MKKPNYRIIWIFLLLLIAISLTSCKIFQQPTITNGDVSLVKLTIDDTQLILPLLVDNENGYKVDLEDLNIKIMNEDRQLIGYIEPVDQVTLVPKDTTEIDLKIHMETRKVAKTITHAKNNIVFLVSGTTHAKALGVGKNIKFEKRIEMPLKEYLTKAVNEGGDNATSNSSNISGGDFIRIMKTKMEYLSFGESQFSIHFMLFNPYGLSLTLTSFPTIIKLNDREAGKGNLRQQLVLTEDTFKTEGDIIFTMDNWKTIGSSLRSALTQELTYECVGKINFNVAGVDLSKPIDFTGKIELSPFRKNSDDK
jgi:LEA14-like dessication related protein